MGKNPFGIGSGKEKSDEDNFITSIFYFMKEFGINPMNPKEGITIPMFNEMMKELESHNRRENEANKVASRRR